MYTVTRETFATLTSYWSRSPQELNWYPVFVLPPWLAVWWEQFGDGHEDYLAAVREDGDHIIGIAPLKRTGDMASIVGSENVCDYVDFVVSPGREKDFFPVLLQDLEQKGVKSLELGLVRPDSLVLTHLAGIAGDRGWKVSTQAEDVSFEMDLPGTWDGYLEGLNTKQRHEVRRKLRRLGEAGHIDYRFGPAGQDLNGLMDGFVRLFSLAHDEKAGFMTPPMAKYFRALADALDRVGVLRIGALDLDGRRVAMIMCFDYNDSVLLYNSGCDPDFESLSVGLLSKVLGIKESIQQGKKKFDFLKGGEVYKERLGGKSVALHRCRIVAGS